MLKVVMTCVLSRSWRSSRRGGVCGRVRPRGNGAGGGVEKQGPAGFLPAGVRAVSLFAVRGANRAGAGPPPGRLAPEPPPLAVAVKRTSDARALGDVAPAAFFQVALAVLA